MPSNPVPPCWYCRGEWAAINHGKPVDNPCPACDERRKLMAEIERLKSWMQTIAHQGVTYVDEKADK